MGNEKPEKKGPLRPDDNESASAVAAVVDDYMRTDVLGPAVVRVLKEYTPAAEQLREMITHAIPLEPVKGAVVGVVEEIDTKRKSRWVDRAIGAAGGVVLAVIIVFVTGWAQNFMDHRQGSDLPTPSPTATR